MCLSCIAATAQQHFSGTKAIGSALVKCPLSSSSHQDETEADAVVRRVANRDRRIDAGCKQSIFERYGVIPRQYLGYIDSSDERVLAELVINLANDRLSPEFLFAVVMREGLNTYFDNGGRRAKKGELPIDGFKIVGTDDFGGNASALIGDGYLRSDYRQGEDFTPYTRYNREIHRNVKTARFTSLKPALEAVAAELTKRRDQMTRDYIAEHSLSEEAELTEAQRDYLNYVYYNVKPKPRLNLVRHTRPGVIRRWSGNPRGAGEKGMEGYSPNAHSNALVTLAISEYLKCVGVFSGEVPQLAHSAAMSSSKIGLNVVGCQHPPDLCNAASRDSDTGGETPKICRQRVSQECSTAVVNS